MSRSARGASSCISRTGLPACRDRPGGLSYLRRRSYAVVRTDRPADEANHASRPQPLYSGWAGRPGSHLADVSFRVEDGLDGQVEAAALRPIAGEEGHGGDLLRRQQVQTLLQRLGLETDAPQLGR